MNRRAYLGSLAGTGVAGLAGCLERINVFGDSNTELGPPEQDLSESIHPTYGEEFPSFRIHDPLADRDITRDEFVDDRAFLMTFIFTSCMNDCGALVNMLQLVQEDAIEQGYEDDIALLAMTFDPETDDAETLREYGERYGVDYDVGNWHFLRPETQERALELVNDEDVFGSPVEVVPPEEGHHHDDEEDSHDEEGDADAENDSHEDDEDEDAEDESHENGDQVTHYYMIFLVNEAGYVERSYPSATTRTRPTELIDDVRTVVE